MAVDDALARPHRILVGVVGAPHGVRGEMRVKSYMAVPVALTEHPLHTAGQGGRLLRMTGARALKDGMIVARLAGVGDREAAAALTGTQLFLDRDRLGPTGEDEFYNADLVGLPVRTTTGVPVGTVAAVVDYGGGDLLEVAAPGLPSRLVPFLKRFVPTVDIAGRLIEITPEALMDEDEGGPEQPA